MGDWAFQYDTLNRLTVMAPSNNAPSADSISLGCYAYDAFGNRTLESLSSVPCNGGNPTPQTANAYNPVNNQLSSSTLSSLTLAAGSIGYDASGNETFDGRNYYWYDAEGRLCTVASASAVQNSNLNGFWQYGYDALGNRFVSGHPAAAPAANASCAPPLGTGYSMQKRYLVGLGGDQVTELSEASGETWLHSNVWMGPKPLATYDTSGIQFYISDPLGTKRIGVNALGVISKTCLSLPYGNDVGNPVAANCTGDNSDEHHFTGKERDAESGNDYFGARYYASSMGRFMSPDKPFADQHPANPQSWNLYSYTRNNPLRFVDDDGEKVNEAPTVIVTYHVSGGTAAEAWNNAPAASGISGGYRGNTDTNIGVGNYSFDTSSKSIGTTTTVTDTLTSADVNLSVTITLPAWDGYSSATPAEQQQWDSLAGGLKDHEDGHKTIAEQGANALDKSLPGTSATGTGNGLPGAQKSAADALGQKVEDKHQGAVQNTQQNQDAYDKRTDHGAKPDPNKPN